MALCMIFATILSLLIYVFLRRWSDSVCEKDGEDQYLISVFSIGFLI